MGIQWKVKAVGGSGGYAKIGKTVYNLNSSDEIILENSFPMKRSNLYQQKENLQTLKTVFYICSAR